MEGIAYPYIAIEGIIGAGKSTLTSLLSEATNAGVIYEEFEENPFLPLFYKEPERYAFQVELSFLAARFHQLKEKTTQPDLFHPIQIADYWFEKCLLFAQNNLNKLEFDLFMNLFGIMNNQLRQPDLILYLHLPVDIALERIAMRGRSYEQEIKAEYLQNLSNKYLNHLKTLQNTRVIILESEHLNAKEHPAHLNWVKDLIQTSHRKGITRITF